MSPPASTVDPGVPAGLDGLGLAVVVVDLDSLDVRAITDAACRVLDRPARSIMGHPVMDLIDPVERGGALAALHAMRSGAIEFYRTHPKLAGASAPGGVIWVWANAVDLGGRPHAFVAWFDQNPDRPAEPRAASKEVLERTIAVGIVDSNYIVRFASAEGGNPLGISAEALVGTRLADERQSRQLTSITGAERAPHDALSFAFPAQVPSRGGALLTLMCVVTALAGSSDRLFMLTQPPDWARVSELERHLWRIAAEVEASGILLRLGSASSLALRRHPGAASLSPKQWEILRRIVDGERVPTIARELFIAPSTVRNHLSAIFERFGVHSQAELLALFARTDIAPGPTDTVSIA